MLEEDLTLHEKIFIERKRSKETIHMAAARHGVSVRTYRMWENGEGDPPNVNLQGIEQREHFMILRMRAGMRQGDLAKLIGVNQTAVGKMEQGTCPLHSLVDFWMGKDAKIRVKGYRPQLRVYNEGR